MEDTERRAAWSCGHLLPARRYVGEKVIVVFQLKNPKFRNPRGRVTRNGPKNQLYVESKLKYPRHVQNHGHPTWMAQAIIVPWGLR